MGNNLERNIAVIFDGAISDAKLATDLQGLVAEFDATFHSLSSTDLITLDSKKFDGLLLVEVEVIRNAAIEKVVRRFHRESKPIGAVGPSIKLMIQIFGSEGIEVTAGAEDSTLAREMSQSGALVTPCPASDYVSDRVFKVLSSPGSFSEPGLLTETSKAGVRKMLREIVEMA